MTIDRIVKKRLHMPRFIKRSYSEEYMSTHSLTFSSPEMTLKKFVLWLGEQVNNPRSKERVPRLMLYIEEKASSIIGKEDSNLRKRQNLYSFEIVFISVLIFSVVIIVGSIY